MAPEGVKVSAERCCPASINVAGAPVPIDRTPKIWGAAASMGVAVSP